MALENEADTLVLTRDSPNASNDIWNPTLGTTVSVTEPSEEMDADVPVVTALRSGKG
jgi:hypothetical protein